MHARENMPLPPAQDATQEERAHDPLWFKDAVIYPVNLPPIPELGTSSGFDLQLEDQIANLKFQIFNRKLQI